MSKPEPEPTCRQMAHSKFPGKVMGPEGLEPIPDGWECLPPGDATLTRRIKKIGPAWAVTERKRGKTFSRGVWAPPELIATLRAELEREREDPAYQRRLKAGRDKRAKQQEVYAEDFEAAVFAFLNFAEPHEAMARRLAKAIAEHAVPVGSGTVARTKRIPIEQRAEAATIAWMRHRTTGYDSLRIARVKGKRREVRRELAQRSRSLLRQYRRDAAASAGEQKGGTLKDCPLRKALRIDDPKDA